jgi:Protein of unknown function (DUF1302)
VVTRAFAVPRTSFIDAVNAVDSWPLPRRSLSAVAFTTACLAGTPAFAFEIETGIPELKASWDTTVKYGAMWRVDGPSSLLINQPPTTVNQDDGDRNFSRGLVSSRFDLFTEADITFRNFGARVSAAGWYDAVYERANDNNSPATANQYTVPFNEFTRGTRKIHGEDFQLLDAFVFGKGSVDDVQGSFRAGKHTLLWGESLFFGANGIAGTQSPVDVVKLLSVPNSQFKETILPVGQVSGQIQLSPTLSVAAYYQFQWTQSRLPAVGSYFSTTDVLDFGGERILTGPPLVPQGRSAAFYRGVDQWASDSGQGGAAVRVRAYETDFGFYAINWHSKSPQLYIKPAVVTPPGGPPIVVDPANFNPIIGQIGQYFLTYPENIRTYGMSASHSIGDINLAGEVSVRRNMPLVSDAQVILPGVSADNRDHPLYAVGNSINAQVSFLWTLPPNFIANEATALGEIAWNHLSSITKNPNALDPNTTQNAAGIQFVYEPIYRQVYAGLDISVPVGGSYTQGRSSTVQGFGVDKGGNLNIGLTATYLNRWRFALNYTHYYGPAGTATDSFSHSTFAQSLADRDFVVFNVRTTF